MTTTMKRRLARIEADRADVGKRGTVSVTELGPDRYQVGDRILDVAELAELERTHRFIIVREYVHTKGGIAIARSFGIGA
jgi:hypothetical protein